MRCLSLLLVAVISLVGCSAESVSTPSAPASPAADGNDKKDGSEDKGDSEGATTEVNFNTQKLPTLALLVPAIHCEACAAGVSSTLAEVEGVQDVKVDVESKVATIAIDKDAFDPDAAIAALAEQSFPEATLVSDEEATAGDAS